MPYKKRTLDCGIYQIKNVINNDFYIGQTSSFAKRKNAHFRDLKNNIHPNVHLQYAWNLYGEENFIFKPILYCEPTELTYYEQSLVDIWNPHYNIRKDCVDSNLGIIFSEEVRLHMSESRRNMSKETRDRINSSRPPTSDETKRRISESKKGTVISDETKIKISMAISGSANGMFGKTHTESARKIQSEAAKRQGCSEETRKKMSDSRMGINNSNILDRNIVLQIKNLLDEGISAYKIRKILGVCPQTIYKVRDGGYKDIYGI